MLHRGGDAATGVLHQAHRNVTDGGLVGCHAVVDLHGEVLGEDAAVPEGDQPQSQRLRLDGVGERRVGDLGGVDVGLDALHGRTEGFELLGVERHTDGTLDFEELETAVLAWLDGPSEHRGLRVRIVHDGSASGAALLLEVLVYRLLGLLVLLALESVGATHEAFFGDLGYCRCDHLDLVMEVFG